MLYHLLYPLAKYHSLRFLNVLRYVPTRAILASLTALLLSLLLGPWFIRRLQRMQISEQIRNDGPEAHQKKAGTPTMGGTLILFSFLVPVLLWCDLNNGFIWAAVSITVGYGILGFIDDYYKLKFSKKGLSAKTKLVVQIIWAVLVISVVFYSKMYTSDMKFRLALPLTDFFKVKIILHAAIYGLLAVIVIVGFSNAVNLTDGLDGLAIGPVIIAAGTLLIFTYIGGGEIIIPYKGGKLLAEYLKIPYIAHSQELAIFCSSLVGAGIGFLWYNTHPAQMFMGDVGSLSLGGALGTVAFLSKNEFVMVILGGLFVIEAASVILQVLFFKLRGKRIFKMAPLHHHFELKGWAESKVIVRFWIISIILALLALATLKVR